MRLSELKVGDKAEVTALKAESGVALGGLVLP